MSDAYKISPLRRVFDPLGWLCLAAGIVSLAYGTILADAFFRGDPVWRDIAMATEPLAKGLAIFVPVIDRVYEHLASRGDVERALLARHLYTAAWYIMLVALLPLYGRVKSVAPDLLRHPERYRVAWNQALYPQVRVPPENMALAIFLGCVALFGFDAWYGAFVGGVPSIMKNMVHERDLDLVRLAITVPFLVGALVLSTLVALSMRRGRGNVDEINN